MGVGETLIVDISEGLRKQLEFAKNMMQSNADAYGDAVPDWLVDLILVACGSQKADVPKVDEDGSKEAGDAVEAGDAL